MAPDLITYAIPGFVLLLLLEIVFTTIDKRNMYEPKDALSSIAMGLGNVFIGIFTKAVIFSIYLFVYQFRLFTLGFTWWAWVLCFFADDFSYYWFHRGSHQVRFFWASHVIHHSSESITWPPHSAKTGPATSPVLLPSGSGCRCWAFIR